VKTLIVPAIIAKTQEDIDMMLLKVKGKVERIMVDVMDGKFVPNTSLMFDFRLMADFEFEAHLMVNDPLDWVEKNYNKVNIIIIHVEALRDIEEAINFCKKNRLKVSLALRPETDIDTVLPYLEKIYGVLIMTADPGSYCMKFLPESIEKIKRLRGINNSLPIEVDGCMNPKNAGIARNAGANVFASGSYIFKSANIDKAIQELNKAVV
jgi:ribulose-phosphate 3-epimerase